MAKAKPHVPPTPPTPPIEVEGLLVRSFPLPRKARRTPAVDRALALYRKLLRRWTLRTGALLNAELQCLTPAEQTAYYQGTLDVRQEEDARARKH